MINGYDDSLDTQAALANALRGGQPMQPPIASPTPPMQVAGLGTKLLGTALGGAGIYGLSKMLRKKPDVPAGGRTTEDAFRQHRETQDAVEEEMRRQQGRGAEQQYLNRMEKQLEEQGK